jgi:myosin heavy subunit
MDDLTPLNAASILENIRIRFRLDQIYTRTGPILIAMNPFKRMPQLYADTVMQRYKGKPYGDCAPHPYQEAEDCVQRLQGFNESQCVVICGESGAGKTETTKIMLNYISKAFAKPGQSSAAKSLGERMVDANPVLEAVGNAKTLRNNNSSRFGKFTMYAFDKDRRNITGGRVSNFLLEKARVSDQSEGACVCDIDLLYISGVKCFPVCLLFKKRKEKYYSLSLFPSVPLIVIF